MSKIKISTSKRDKKNTFNLPTRTITTLDFGRLCCTNVIECTPGDTIKTRYFHDTQTASLVSATFGSAYIKTFSTFVPYRVVWRQFEDYMVKTKDSTIETEVPRFSYYTLYRFMFGLKFGQTFEPLDPENIGSSVITDLAESVGVEEFNGSDFSRPDWLKGYDFAFYNPSDSVLQDVGVYRFKLTKRGRWFVHILESLGYKLPRLLPVVGGSSADFWGEYRSALPLLCYVRFLYDWIYPSQYVQQQGFAYLFENVGAIDGDVIKDIFRLLFVPYAEDFFTSLWLNPNSVGSSTDSINAFGFNSVSDLTSVVSNVNQVYLNQDSPERQVSVSSYGLRLLESISDYVTRNNIGGTRFHEWMKSHFGFVTQEQDSNRSIFLKSFSDELRFSPIYANTAVEGLQNLGSRAGIGNSSGNGTLTFDAKEHGLLLFVTMVIPSTGYVQGEKPWVKNVGSPFDFYTPELDSVGLEPVPRSRVYMDYTAYGVDNGVAPLNRINEVFGFAPRYADRFKHGHDFLHGDFTLDSRNLNMSSYHTFRDVLYDRWNLALDAQFLQADDQYDRIFASDPSNEVSDSYDKFVSIFVYDTKRYSNMLSIGESMPIFNKSGEDTTLDNTGTNLI